MGHAAPRVCVVNLGCRVNRVESDWMETSFVQAGSSLCAEEEADIVAINTCAVTGEAQAKTRKAVRHAAGLPRRPLVAVTGCVANLFPAELESLGGNVRVFPAKLSLVHDALELYRESFEPVAEDFDGASRHEGDALNAGEGVSGGDGAHAVFRARRGVKIQDGCDNRCTYCIVWRARGTSFSTPYPEIERQVRQVLFEGALEVDLTGINLGRYASEDAEGNPLGLAGLIDRLAVMARRAGALVRASSIEPPEVTPALVDAFARNADVVAPHLHLPLQAGSTTVLRRMGRRYSAEQFLDKVALIRAGLPGAAVSTDIIVGFPGETEGEFAETLALAEAAAFSKVHAFRFSARPDTPAAAMPDQVDAEVLRERSGRLRALADRLRAADAAARVGGVERVLVERVDARGAALGTTASHHDVVLPAGSHVCTGPALVRAELTGVQPRGAVLEGRVVEDA